MRWFGLLIIFVIVLSSAELRANAEIWQQVTQLQARAADGGARHYNVDNLALRAKLDRVAAVALPDSPHLIELPMPDGSFARFEIYEAAIMQDGLAARYPQIKTFKVIGIDDKSASGRVDITPSGFHAMLQTSQGRLFVDPDTAPSNTDRYLSRYRSAAPGQGYSCGIHELDFGDRPTRNGSSRSAARVPGSLLEYRLAVAATEEYANAVYDSGNPDTRLVQAQAAIVTAINRVTFIYERDLGVTFELVSASSGELIENNGDAGFTNGSAFQMFDENQAWIDAKVGSANYDIGHVFSTGSGGLGWLGSTCDGDNKAKGVSGVLNPLGDPFYIDFVAHEIGHQFNADHSFNGTTLSCGNGRNAATAYEPGSGSTIMAYAGICGVEDIQSNSDPSFHAVSIAQINSFTAGAGSCYSQIATSPANNTDPVVGALVNKTIPANTPFLLKGSATDAEMHALTYQWDQMDVGCSTDAVSYGTDNGSNALFRSYIPRGDFWRNFPALGTQFQNLYDDAEVLPCNNRDLDFRLTARDQKSGQDFSNVRVSVKNSAGPFEITSLGTARTITSISDLVTVSWNVANTNLPPINCSLVDIDLLTFSDTAPVKPATYSIHPLVASTTNDGNAVVNLVPVTKSHPRARIRVKCSNNIFYDISDADLDIDGTTSDKFSDTQNVTFFNNNGTTGSVAAACGAVVNCTSRAIEGGSDSGALDYIWLLLMTGMLAVVKCYRRYGLQ